MPKHHFHVLRKIVLYKRLNNVIPESCTQVVNKVLKLYVKLIKVLMPYDKQERLNSLEVPQLTKPLAGLCGTLPDSETVKVNPALDASVNYSHLFARVQG